MSTRVQAFLLANTKGLQYLINERLAKRSGLIGSIFKGLRIGERQYGTHAAGRTLKVINYFWMWSYQVLAMQRQPFSRFNTNVHAPLNFSAFYVHLFVTGCIMARFKFERARDILTFNA